MHGALTGLRRSCSLYPEAIRTFCSFICEKTPPEFVFSNIAIFQNLRTELHRDKNNLRATLNFAVAISAFEGGQVWIQADPASSKSGILLDVTAQGVYFNARERLHCTCPWTGSRVVVVAFSLRGSDCLPKAEALTLSSLGFRVPSPGVDNSHLESSGRPCSEPPTEVPPPFRFRPPPPGIVPMCTPAETSWSAGSSAATPAPSSSSPPCTPAAACLPAGPDPRGVAAFPPEPPGGNLAAPTFVELFAGCARLSSTFAAAGVPALAVDGPRNQHRPLHPVWTLDLTVPLCQRLLRERLLSGRLLGIHLGLPCGTGSRAREIKLPAHLLRSGAPQPRPLRDATYLLGLPGLSSAEQAKVDAANELCRFVVSLLLDAYAKGWTVTIENPVNSWMWSVLALFVRRTGKRAFQSWYASLFHVDFDQCMWGGHRKKASRFLTSASELRGLVAPCDGRHTHAPFQIYRKAGGWQFETALEAEYPAELCLQYVSLLGARLSLPAPAPRRPLLRQPRRRPPLVPEYKFFTHVRPLEGEFRELSSEGGGDGSRSTFAVLHTKQEFVAKACQVPHPFDASDSIDDQVKRNIFELFTGGFMPSARKRLSMQKRLAAMKKELAVEERRYQASLPPHAQAVLKGKNILLWRKLLVETGFPDLDAQELMEGVPLIGRPTKSPLYDWKEIPATCTREDLLASSVWRNKMLSGKGAVGDDADLLHKVWLATEKEVEKGYLIGPYESLEDVKATLGAEEVCCSRRFGVRQGSGDSEKCRPIDDYKESGVNTAYHAVDLLQLHDVDYLVNLCCFVANAAHDDGFTRVGLSDGSTLVGRTHGDLLGGVKWLGRCLDLEKAYKQIPVMAKDLVFAVLMVWEPGSGSWKYFISRSLPFGCCAAVYGFNRVSRSLLHLALHLAGMIGGVYFDDFPLLEPAPTARMGSLAIECLLDALGWSYAVGDDKGRPFEETFDLLGMRLSVGELLAGQVALANKPSRVEKIRAQASRMASSGCVTRREAASLHGQLNFMVGFAAGRAMKIACRALANICYMNRSPSVEEVKSLGRFILKTLSDARPRTFSLRAQGSPVSIFTDASYEKGVARWGIVLLDQSSNRRWVAAGEIPPKLVDFWLAEGIEQVISQAEAYALVLSRRACASELAGKRCIFYVDNDAARYTCIKASSPSRSLLNLACLFYASESADGIVSWIERVPSASNVADLPSRGEAALAAQMIGGQVVDFSQAAQLLADECMDLSDLPWDLLSSSSGNLWTLPFL